MVSLLEEISQCVACHIPQHSNKVLDNHKKEDWCEDGRELLFGLPIVRRDFLPRNNPKHLVHG